ncbi:hypothetical protein ACMFMF_000850 [Clarireedia jacksonii]
MPHVPGSSDSIAPASKKRQRSQSRSSADGGARASQKQKQRDSKIAFENDRRPEKDNSSKRVDQMKRKAKEMDKFVKSKPTKEEEELSKAAVALRA